MPLVLSSLPTVTEPIPKTVAFVSPASRARRPITACVTTTVDHSPPCK